MPKALYRKYRSKKLDEVIGQKHITDILARAISQGRVSHAYLLSGPRGVGKTSVARILAHEINNLPYDEENVSLDIIEIDAASNNGVEDVRDLREKVQIAPVSASKKIYIIDEVHMLSKAAFNALLKTLEEPPEHVVFILATTNVEKLPATIISRTQQFCFRPINIDDVAKHLSDIAIKENIKINDDALKLIARRGEGSFRDSISLLDQLSNISDSGQTINIELIEATLGLAPNDLIDNLINAVENHDIESIVKSLNKAFDDGVDVNILTSQLTEAVRYEIAQKPQLLNLLDSLIDVPKSSYPNLKLLSVLGIAAQAKKAPKSAALIAPAMEISATIEELQKQAVMDNFVKEKPIEKTKPTPKAEEKIISKAPIIRSDSKPFDWANLLDYTKRNCVAIYSVLSKCGHEIDGDTLVLYTLNNFYKKKLDDVKYSPLINKSLQEIGCYNLAIKTVPTQPPLKDSQAAAVAAIMGGGEEVSIETV